MTALANSAGRWLLAVIFLTLPLNTLRPFKSIAVADLLIALLLPVALFLLLARPQWRIGLRRLPNWLWIGGLLLLISIALVQIFPPLAPGRLDLSFGAYGTDGSPSIVVGLRVIFALIAFPVLIALLVERFSRIGTLISFWIAGVSISCAVALLDLVFGLGIQHSLAYDPAQITGFLNTPPGTVARQVGLTDHPNTLSLTAVMVSPLVMARMKTRRGLIRYGPVLVLIALGVLVSGTRVGVLGMALVVVIFLLMEERIRDGLRGMNRRTVATAIVALLALAAVMLVSAYASPESKVGKIVPPSLTRLLNSKEATTGVSDDLRESWFESSRHYIAERPFTGYGFQWVEASHNTVLQLLLAGGILALIGFYLVLFGYLRTGYHLRLKVPEGMSDVSVALTISLFAYAVSGLVDNHVYERYLYIPAGLILALYLLRRAEAPGYVESSES